jgi:hypothetical protein
MSYERRLLLMTCVPWLHEADGLQGQVKGHREDEQDIASEIIDSQQFNRGFHGFRGFATTHA